MHVHRSQKNNTQSFCANFVKRRPILILSVLHSQMTAEEGRIICHLASNVLSHYLAKLEHSTA